MWLCAHSKSELVGTLLAIGWSQEESTGTPLSLNVLFDAGTLFGVDLIRKQKEAHHFGGP